MNRKHTIDFIKGISIIFVVITHFGWTSEQRLFPAFPYVIDMAVPIFMIITGYVYSLSADRRGIRFFEDSYNRDIIIIRILRYTLPFVVVAVVEIVVYLILRRDGVLEMFRNLICGTAGPGSYYYPVMIQLVFTFPIIFVFVRRRKWGGVLLAFIINLVYEVLVWAYGIPTGSYRLLVFRYTFLVAVGAFLYQGGRFSRKVSLSMGLLGAGYIAIITYTEYDPMIFNSDWAGTNCISALFIVPLMAWLLQSVHVSVPPLEVLGKASYNIFLFQMMYYRYAHNILGKWMPSWWMHFIIGIIICIVGGLLFYKVESPITKRIIKWVIGRVTTN